MLFCMNCGKQLPDGAKFCAECGTPVHQASAQEQRKTVYEGEIHKCPQCGEVLKAFAANCPACGCELRNVHTTTARQKFNEKLEKARNDTEKIQIIQNFLVPNTKEDIIEFMILASANFDASYHAAHQYEEDVSDAWLSMIEQCYQKASFTFRNEPGFDEIKIRYEEAQKKKDSSILIFNKMVKEERERDEKTENKVTLSMESEKFKKGILLKILIGYVAVVALLVTLSFVMRNLGSGILGIVVLSTAVVGLLMGLNVIAIPTLKILRIRDFSILISIVLFVPLIVFFVRGFINPDLVKIGISSEEMSSMKYVDVEEYLTEKGFLNIEIRENDTWISQKEPEEILSITIDGQSEFKHRKKFNKNSKILIVYNASPKEVVLDKGSAELMALSHLEVCDYFENKGFVFVECNAIKWSPDFAPDSIKEITVNSSSDFKSESRFTQDAKIRIVYYAQPEKVNIGYGTDEIVNKKEANEIVELLRDKGFAFIETKEVPLVANAVPKSVKGITINGVQSFSATTTFSQSDKVTIYYYENAKEITIGTAAKAFKDELYTNVVDRLKALGFLNIETKEYPDLINGWINEENSVESISINGNTSFEATDKFFSDARIVITYHTFKNKK